MTRHRENRHPELAWIVFGALWGWTLLIVCAAGAWPTRLPTVQFTEAEIRVEAPTEETPIRIISSVIHVEPPVARPMQVSVEVDPPLATWLSGPNGQPLHGMPIALTPGQQEHIVELQVHRFLAAVAEQKANLKLVIREGVRAGERSSQTVRVESHPESITVKLALVGAKNSLREGATEEHVTVQAKASTAAESEIKIPFRLDGTATPDGDYTVQPSRLMTAGGAAGTLVIEAGYDTAELMLSQRDDDEGNEGEEYIELSFSPPSIGSFKSGSPTRFRIPVLDDDLPPIALALEADKRILDEGKPQDSAAVIGRIDAPAAQEISLDYQLGGSAVAGRDFKVSDPRLVIPRGQREGRLAFTVIPNTTYQGPRDVQIVFPRRAGMTFLGDTKFQLQIEDDDPKEVKLELSKSRLEERVPGDTATLVALLPAPAEEDITLPLTLGGSAEATSDFDVSTTSLVVRAGEHRGQVSFTVRDDNRPEGTEHIEIRVTPATALKINSPTEFQIEILDDEIEGRALVLLLATSYMGQRTAEFQRRLESLCADPRHRDRLIGRGVVLVLAPQNGRPRAEVWPLEKDKPELQIPKESQIPANAALEDVFNAAFQVLGAIKASRQRSGHPQPFPVFLLWPETRDPTELATGGAQARLQMPPVGQQELYTCMIDYEGPPSRWLEQNLGKHGRPDWDAVRYFHTGQNIGELINADLDAFDEEKAKP